jgi:hypothetical protein
MTTTALISSISYAKSLREPWVLPQDTLAQVAGLLQQGQGVAGVAHGPVKLGQAVQAHRIAGVVLAQASLVEVAGLLVQGPGICIAAQGAVLRRQVKDAEDRMGVVLAQQLPPDRQRLAGQRQCFPRTALAPEGIHLIAQGIRLPEAPAVLRL